MSRIAFDARRTKEDDTLSSNRSLFPTFILISFLSLAALGGPRESGAGELQATWMDNSSNEDGFKIERRTGTTQTYTQVAIAGANVTSYNDSGLVDGETYCYRVLAFNAAGSSSYSNEVCAAARPDASGGMFGGSASKQSFRTGRDCRHCLLPPSSTGGIV